MSDNSKSETQNSKLFGIDHLIYAAPTLEMGIQKIEQILGVRPVLGGQHQGRGTHNALLALGKNTYLEIIAPDPTQPNVSRPLWMKADQAEHPQLWTWAVANNDLQDLAKKAEAYQIPLGEIKSGERTQTDGNVLRWQLTEPVLENADGLIPFFIDWGNTIHPAENLPQAGNIIELKAFHPTPEIVRQQLEKLNVKVVLEKAEIPRMECLIRGVDGSIKKL